MSKRSTGWSRKFDEPIALADGGKLVTLRVPRRWRQSAFPGRVVARPRRTGRLGRVLLRQDEISDGMVGRVARRVCGERQMTPGVQRDQLSAELDSSRRPPIWTSGSIQRGSHLRLRSPRNGPHLHRVPDAAVRRIGTSPCPAGARFTLKRKARQTCRAVREYFHRAEMSISPLLK
jgi:hypothetical protein